MKVAVVGSRTLSEVGLVTERLDAAWATWGRFTLVTSRHAGSENWAYQWARDGGAGVEIRLGDSDADLAALIADANALVCFVGRETGRTGRAEAIARRLRKPVHRYCDTKRLKREAKE